MSNHVFSKTRIGVMLREARESGDERLETRALYIWGCRQYRKMLAARPYIRSDRFALRAYEHASDNFQAIPASIRRAVMATYARRDNEGLS